MKLSQILPRLCSVRHVLPHALAVWCFSMTGGLYAQTIYNGECDCHDSGTVAGFRAFALLTDNQNWQEKWNTPPETAVQFDNIGLVHLGETAILLIFFANPMLRNGVAEVECELKISKPDDEVEDWHAVSCWAGGVDGPVENVRLAGLRIEVEVEPSDPSGVWIFGVGVRDVLRDVRVPLEVSLLVDNGGGEEE